ncbi:MAG: leucine-rich repeat domain-containing protein [Clostridia bacterium]|nr:leucine-rich repeat domain-containing protein [Clostridia bacterium]
MRHKSFYKYVMIGLSWGIMMLFFAIMSSAQELKDDIFIYSVNNGCAVIESCTNQYKYKITIPKKVGEYPVKSIASGAFYGNEHLTELEISEGIETVGEFSFYMCAKLEKVTLPKSLKRIEKNAFAMCENLGEIELFQNVQKIGEGAFQNCKRITVSKANKNYSSDERGALFNKDKTVLIQYPANSEEVEYVVPRFTEKIEDRAFFQSKNLQKISFLKKVTTIGKEAFAESGITYINIPQSVENIGKMAFAKTAIVSATLPDEITQIPEKLFYLCTLLERVNISSNTESIGDSAFFGCEKLLEFDFPTSLTRIGKGAFFGCKALRSIVIPEGTEIIRDNTFYRSGINVLTLPASVKYIGYEAFSQCKHLESVVYNASKEKWEEIYIGENNESLTECEKEFRNFDISFDIKETKTKSVGHGEILVLYADTEKYPTMCRIMWSVNGDAAQVKQSVDGTACHVIPQKSGTVTVRASLVDQNGNITVNSDGKEIVAEKEIKVKVNFFRKAVRFIKDLFNLTRYVF